MISKWHRRLGKLSEEPKHLITYPVKRLAERADSRISFGRNIFHYEWDVCVILDACRMDLMMEFGPTHNCWELFDSVNPAYTLASATPDWISRTLEGADDKILESTVYISSTGMINKGPLNKLGVVDEVWRYASGEKDVPPISPVTERAAEYIHNDDNLRVVIHYTLPHAPFPHCPQKYHPSDDYEGYNTQKVWQGLEDGRFDPEEVWEDYGQALLRGLDEVERLLLDSTNDFLITSDHANLFGEYHLYGHPTGYALPALRRVPWIKSKGKGDQPISLRTRDEFGDSGRDIEEHLDVLGYR